MLCFLYGPGEPGRYVAYNGGGFLVLFTISGDGTFFVTYRYNTQLCSHFLT